MKKVAAIFLTILYLLPAIGFSIDVHLCGNKTQSIGINKLHGSKCSCGSTMPRNCCKDIHASIKLKDNHKASSQVLTPQTDFIKQLHGVLLPFNLVIAPVVVFNFSNYHSPPFKSKQPVYLDNSTFRI